MRQAKRSLEDGLRNSYDCSCDTIENFIRFDKGKILYSQSFKGTLEKLRTKFKLYNILG